MKYIDADKLKARIEKYLTYDNSIDTAFYIGRRDAERSILDLITSLQQEQPNAYDIAMLEVKEYVDKLYDDTSIGLNEYDAGLYNGIIDTCMKLRGFIKARTSKEQPEVDLKREITPSLVENMLYKFGVQSIEDIDGETLAELARHFYELGLNARKEECK